MADISVILENASKSLKSMGIYVLGFREMIGI